MFKLVCKQECSRANRPQSPSTGVFLFLLPAFLLSDTLQLDQRKVSQCLARPSPASFPHAWWTSLVDRSASLLMTIMNVSKFAENLVKKYISFLLRSIPLTTKLRFKIHNLFKSRTSLNKIMWSSDVQTSLYSRNTLSSFTTICQIFIFFKSTVHGRHQVPFPIENRWR